MTGRGVYLDIKKIADAEIGSDHGYFSGLLVDRRHRLHTVFRTLEGIGWTRRSVGAPGLDYERWQLTQEGWDAFEKLRLENQGLGSI